MAQGTVSRERIVCENCELPHYGDRAGCPYCETAGVGTADPSSGGREATAESTSGGTDGTERESLLGRLKRSLGM